SPPPPNIWGYLDGPPVTARQIKLRDGRHQAYKEHDVPKETTNFKGIFIHGFTSCHLDPMIASSISPINLLY
ncbi:hypothetical protein LINPERPRIM_LOCUS11129, partial [Linum perenne]